MKKCIRVHDIVVWTIAGYAAYLIILYAYRKPACEYAQTVCQQLNPH